MSDTELSASLEGFFEKDEQVKSNNLFDERIDLDVTGNNHSSNQDPVNSTRSILEKELEDEIFKDLCD